MNNANWDWSARGWPRAYTFTALGTVVCIAVAFAFDGYSFRDGTWRWGADPINNLIIPLTLAPPFLLFLLSKLRDLAIAHHELMTIASTDSLTCLLNRRAFTAIVDGYLDRIAAGPAKSEAALLVIDVDHFKAVNDRFGHDCGDEALKLIARTITGVVRDIDVVGRMGGEEFCVFVQGLKPERIAATAERIRAAVDEAGFVAHGCPYRLSVSIGGVTFTSGASFSSLYRSADQWLYSAKKSGRNRVEVHSFSPSNLATAH
jgi:diguanylate cyclase (GGDEF)-like protein